MSCASKRLIINNQENAIWNFLEKTALVVGASSGIGKETALMFARAGASVVLAARREELLQEITDSIKNESLQAAQIECDVTDEEQVKRMVDFAAKTFGRLDFAYNNSGIMGADIETAETSLEDYDRIVNTNQRGVFLCMKYELRQMLKQGGEGYSIVNCSSIGGLVGMPGRVATMPPNMPYWAWPNARLWNMPSAASGSMPCAQAPL